MREVEYAIIRCTAEQKKYLDEHYGKCKVQTEEEKKIKERFSP